MISSIFLAIFFILASSIALGGEVSKRTSDTSPLTNTEYLEYKSMYGNSSLCSSSEITLWECKTKRKIFALCSSQTVTKESGYIQYRASQERKIIFSFPNTKKPPYGQFTYQRSASGDASLSFSNEGFLFEIIDPLRDRSIIEVHSKSSNTRPTYISCNNPNQSLQINYTIKLMEAAGISSQN